MFAIWLHEKCSYPHKKRNLEETLNVFEYKNNEEWSQMVLSCENTKC